MANYATGKRSKAISDRSGMEFPYREMVREWNGAFVHISEFDHLQYHQEQAHHIIQMVVQLVVLFLLMQQFLTLMA